MRPRGNIGFERDTKFSNRASGLLHRKTISGVCCFNNRAFMLSIELQITLVCGRRSWHRLRKPSRTVPFVAEQEQELLLQYRSQLLQCSCSVEFGFNQSCQDKNREARNQYHKHCRLGCRASAYSPKGRENGYTTKEASYFLDVCFSMNFVSVDTSRCIFSASGRVGVSGRRQRGRRRSWHWARWL